MSKPRKPEAAARNTGSGPAHMSPDARHDLAARRLARPAGGVARAAPEDSGGGAEAFMRH